MAQDNTEIELAPSLADIVGKVMNEFPRADVRVEFDRPHYYNERITPVLTVVTDLDGIDEYRDASDRLSSLVRSMESDDEMVYTRVEYR